MSDAGSLKRSAGIPAAPLLAALLLAGVAGGLVASGLGANLSTPLPPFNAEWDPGAEAGFALLAAGVLAAIATAGPRLLAAEVHPAGFAAATAGASLAAMLAASAAGGGGTEAWVEPLGRAGANSYLPALPALDPGIGTFLDRFAETALTLPIHPSAHPPGLLVALSAIGIDSAGAMAALAIGASALIAPLTYAAGRALGGEDRARAAALLAAASPAVLVYGATSADGLFAALGTAAAAALLRFPGRGAWAERRSGAPPRRGDRARRSGWGLAGPVAFAAGTLFAYSLSAVGAWAALVRWARAGLAEATRVAVACGLALVALYGGLYLAFGFDLLGALAGAADAYELGVAGVRPYWYWLLGSPAAFAVAAGLPVAWLALLALQRGDPAALALAAVVAIAAVLGFTKGETERIWLFLVPYACLAAAAALPPRRLGPVLALLGAQALAVELLFDTYW